MEPWIILLAGVAFLIGYLFGERGEWERGFEDGLDAAEMEHDRGR